MRWRRPLALVPVVGLLVAAPAWAQGAEPSETSPAIVPSAGTGPFWPNGGGFSGDGGPASQAEIDHPSQVEALPGGGYLFTDTSNHRIRLVRADGTIETVAGNGQQCPAPTDASPSASRAPLHARRRRSCATRARAARSRACTWRPGTAASTAQLRARRPRCGHACGRWGRRRCA